MEPNDTHLSPLGSTKGRLQEVRRRWIVRRAIAMTSAAVAVGAVSLAALALAAWITGAQPLWAERLVVGVFIGALAAAALAVWRARPSIADAARMVDRRYDLKSRLSTASELERLPRPVGVEKNALRDALMRDSEACAVSVVPTEVVRFGVPFVPLVVAAVAVALSVVLPRLPAYTDPRVVTAEQRPALTDHDRAEMEAELERLADVIQDEAERLDDPYLSALSSALRDLAARVAAGEEGLSELASDTEILLGHVDATTTSDTPSASSLDDAPVDVLSGAPVYASEGVGGTSPTTPDDILNELRARSEALETAAAERAARPSGMAYDYVEPEALQARSNDQAAGMVAQGEGAGAPAGAAMRSTDAPGDAAGRGAQELFGEDGSQEASFQSSEAVELPDAAEIGSGARVQALGDPGEPGSPAVAGAVGSGGAAASPRSGSDARGDREPDPAREEAGDWRRTPLDPSALSVARTLYAPADPDW